MENVTGTIVYNKEYQQIYPISHAQVIITEAGNEGKTTVETALNNIWDKLSELDGSQESASNILVKVDYCKTNTKVKKEVELLDTWSDTFELPDQKNPYIWKRTVFTYRGDEQELNKIYEIVATDTAQIIQNIYIARSTGVAPTITYPILVDGEGEPVLDEEGHEQEDLTAFDDKLPEGWLETPVSISPATPYVFMSTRKRVEGLWQRFSEPAQFGRWAYDSQVEIRYAVTEDSTPPEVKATEDDPGSNWSQSTPPDFTGWLWMITATSVNGIINKDDNDVRWKGPNLLSIIK